MKTLVQVLRSEGRAYKDPKSGRISKRCVCQCVVHNIGEDGEIKLDVGVLVVPDNLCPIKAPDMANMDTFGDVPAGDYIAEYGLNIDWKTKELGGQLKALTRRDAKPQVKPEAQAAAKQ